MKKRIVIGLISSIFIIALISSFVSAAIELPAAPYGPWAPLANMVKGALEGIAGSVNFVLGGAGLGPESFGKLLLFILLTLVLLRPAKKIVGEKEGLGWIIAIIVSILGIYWIPASLISTIIFPYNALGIAVVTVIPLMLYVFFLESTVDNPTIRKICWIIAAIIFFGFWIYRMADPKITPEVSSFLIIYPIAAVACLAFLWFDGTLRSWWLKSRIEGARGKVAYTTTIKLQAQMNSLVEQMAAPGIKEEDRKKLVIEIADIMKRIRQISKL